MKIQNISVLGAGVLGAQIAFQAAYAGFHVVSYDISDAALAAAATRFDSLQATYLQAVEGADASRLAQTRQRLTQSSQLAQAVAQADIVIEAVPEKLPLKQQVWAEAGAAAPAHSILATNTSTLLPSSFSKASGHPERFLALHFANNIWVQNIVEVMGTAQTRPAIVQATEQFAKDMGMNPIVLHKEQPGYVINSLLVPLFDAASHLFANGVASPQDIDKAWRMATRAPSGPFQMMDVVGLRTVYAIHAAHAEETGNPLGLKFVQRLKAEYLDKGKTGKESGSGFYDYDAQGQII